MLKRLDDCDKTVRELSIGTIKSCFVALLSVDKPEEIVSKTILEFIYSTMLIHLDDQDKSIQALVFGEFLLIFLLYFSVTFNTNITLH